MAQAANPYAAPASQTAPEAQRKPVSKTALLLLTFFFGGIGAHRFYLGKYGQGALYLAFSWTLIPALMALGEFIVYVFTSPARLNEKYSADGSVVVTALVIVLFVVVMVGLVAAVAIPAHAERIARARAAEAIFLAKDWQRAVELHYIDLGKLPNGLSELRKDTVPAQAESRYASVSLGANGTLT